MKRNLLTIVLALALAAALTFVIAPSAKAETAETVMKATGTSLPDGFDYDSNILDLNGHNVTVEVPADKTLSVINTSFIQGETLILNGKHPGTLENKGAGKIASVTFDGNYRYFAKNENGTYTFHPFNLVISRLGLNTIGSEENGPAVCIGVTFVADEVVKTMLEAEGNDYGLKNITLGAELSAKTNYKFGNVHGVLAYFDLVGSLKSENIDKENEFQAYIKIGSVEVYGNYVAKVTPREVLKHINKTESIVPTTSQSERIETLMAENARVKNIFTRFSKVDCAHRGGEATCTALAECIDCDKTYGEIAHTYADARDIKCENCAAVRKVLYGDDFDVEQQSAKNAGWNSKAGTIADGVFSFTQNTTTAKASYHMFENAAKFTVELDFTLDCVDGDNSSHAVIRLRNVNNKDVLRIAAYRDRVGIGTDANSDGDWEYVDVPYDEGVAGTFHKMKVVINTKVGTYDVYIDGVLLKEGTALSNDYAVIDRLMLGAQSGSVEGEDGVTTAFEITASYDNVSVYCDAENVIHSDDFDDAETLKDAGWTANESAKIENGTLNITHASDSGNTAITYKFEGKSKVTVEFDLTLNYSGTYAANAQAIIQLRYDSSKTKAAALVIRANKVAGTGVTAADYKDSQTYGTTHKVKIDIDGEAKTVNVYIDGILRIEDADFVNDTDSINQLVLGAQSVSSEYPMIVSYDNLLICTQ